MLVLRKIKRSDQLLQISYHKLFSSISSSCQKLLGIDEIIRIINDHPFPDKPLQPILLQYIQPTSLSSSLVENVLGRLFAAHSNGLKALEFFKFALLQSQFSLSSVAFENTLHILSRMRYFDKAWDLMVEISKIHPSMLTLKSMSIMLSKIAKFDSYEATIEAFEKMEKEIFVDTKFGIDQFNALLRAFSTQRDMKEARSVFNKMHSRFPPNNKTMNILLSGFRESGDITAMELFYHKMVRRGFKPNTFTYNTRIDAYCKKGCLSDGLRLMEEMEQPSLETITTLIHGAGIVRNPLKAKQLFDEIPKRGLELDVGVYNALISAYIRSRDVKSAIKLMFDMEEKDIELDNVTYHTMFLGTMRSSGIEGVCDLYYKMIEKKFVPKARTVVMVMKVFCFNGRLDMGMHLWEYLVDRGCCPHAHALDLLATALCSRGRLEEAFQCSIQMSERGKHLSEMTYCMLERLLRQAGWMDKLSDHNGIRSKLHAFLPLSPSLRC